MEAIKSFSIAEQVYDILKGEVMKGAYAPGEKIAEQDVADRLRVSRSPVREAIRRLSNEGMIDYFPNRGAYIKQYTSKDVLNSFEVRLLLETYAIAHPDPALREALSPEIDGLVQEIWTAEREESDALDVRVHEMSIRMSGNDALMNLYRLLYSQISTFRTISVLEDSMLNMAKRSHEALLRSIQENNISRAIRVITKHLKESEEQVLRYYTG